MLDLQLDPEGAAQAAESISQLPPLLALSPIQLQDISAGFKVFESVLQGILQQQQQLLSTQTGSPHTDSNDSGNSSAARDSSSSGSGSESSCIRGLDANLDAQAQHMSSMRMLFGKEHTMRAVATAWFLGCLTWEQLVKASVMHWPRPMPLLLLAREVARYGDQQQPARQPQQEALQQVQLAQIAQQQQQSASVHTASV
jgi:hypothetical protein